MKKLIALTILAGLAGAGPALAADIDWSKLPPAATAENVTFDKDIAPIFKDSCVRCHGAERPRAQLRLDTLEGVLKGTKQGPVLTAGDSAHSLLVKAVSRLDPETAMPPKPRNRRPPGGPMGTNAPAMQPPPGGPPMGGGPDGGDRPRMGGNEGDRPPGGPMGTNAPADRLRRLGPPPKPLTPEQVGLVRAWIDQGAK